MFKHLLLSCDYFDALALKYYVIAVKVFCLIQDDQQEDLTFPLVDSNAQMQIRRRIVLEKLRKA